MFWLDWIIVWIPLLFVLWAMAISQKYVKGVADFLTAGRVAGRYVVSVANGEAAMGLISVAATMEIHYQCGFAYSFWSTIVAPISLVLGLVGFCTYRFRETKAMTMGQFFEIRYCKSMRVLASIIQSVSGILNYAIFPAVGARFLIYFLDLPIFVNIFGWQCPTFGLVMAIFLSIALTITLVGGQITIMVTDCVQGLLSYPMYVIVVVYLLYRFSWTEEMAPAMIARGPGLSFMDPYDVYNMRDFNLFYVFVGVASMFVNRMSWGGSQGYFGAAKNPHEAKMGGVLGSWRAGLSVMIFTLLTVAVYAYLHHQDFAPEAKAVRTQLACKVADDVIVGKGMDTVREDIKAKLRAIPTRTVFSANYGTDEILAAKAAVRNARTAEEKAAAIAHRKIVEKGALERFHAENDDPYPQLVATEIGKVVAGDTLDETTKAQVRKQVQTFRTIYQQMIVPLATREILPMGITGIFCALMIFLMISTDTTYMHSWGSIIVQDFVVPLRKKAFTPEQQLLALRISIAGVALFVFLFSLFFAQIDYIAMFFMITGAIWSGAGVVITLGLYWSRGTTAGAFTALFLGAGIALAGIFGQYFWAGHIYPWLESINKVEQIQEILTAISGPFNPYIVWTMNPHKFPINSQEIAFIANTSTILFYVVVSLATCRQPFNMDRMLHRGIYADDPSMQLKKEPFSFRTLVTRKMVGIDSNYTKGDKVLAWSVFIYSFGIFFLTFFVGVVIWDLLDPWTAENWSTYFFIKSIAMAGCIGIVTTIWFSICGTRDLFRLFKDLAAKEANALDDGRVVGNISTADAARVAEVEAKQKAEQEKAKEEEKN